mmetsp:Transcript_18301/g.51327  ORF Transcript_18301/g.51327 Transcript_18301/m.51327 type:complete len:204 (+) Transcript_18301:404-1015(+)
MSAHSPREAVPRTERQQPGTSTKCQSLCLPVQIELQGRLCAPMSDIRTNYPPHNYTGPGAHPLPRHTMQTLASTCSSRAAAKPDGATCLEAGTSASTPVVKAHTPALGLEHHDTCPPPCGALLPESTYDLQQRSLWQHPCLQALCAQDPCLQSFACPGRSFLLLWLRQGTRLLQGAERQSASQIVRRIVPRMHLLRQSMDTFW